MTTLHNMRGFSLVEVTLALGIAVFCLVVIFGLLSVGVNTSTTSVEQTSATNVLSEVAGDLRSAPDPYPKGAAATTKVYKLPIPAAAATASPAPTPIALSPPVYLDADGALDSAAGSATYQLNVWMTPGVGRSATIARLMLSWPPAAPTANAGGSVETVIALDRN